MRRVVPNLTFASAACALKAACYGTSLLNVHLISCLLYARELYQAMILSLCKKLIAMTLKK